MQKGSNLYLLAKATVWIIEVTKFKIHVDPNIGFHSTANCNLEYVQLHHVPFLD